MPATHIVQVNDIRIYIVIKNGVPKRATVQHRRSGEFYVHYLDTDKRMDEWVSEDICRLDDGEPLEPEPMSKKRKRGRPAGACSPGTSLSGQSQSHVPVLGQFLVPRSQENGVPHTTEVVMTEEEFDLQHHQKATAQKNFETIIFDVWKINPWYYSPYPLVEIELDEPVAASSSHHAYTKVPGVNRTTARSHGRTSDLLAGGLQRQHGITTLWVCHYCFKYMADGGLWELHKKDCGMKHPPGKKVYQRGAHTIWEVDGAREKLYCQNLSLFGKLFIDVKTLFFDCDNFLFYILTNGTSNEDHIIGFFSKEKFSYDGYNLACIMTLPQHQRKGFGMLMIEFSYELSRRAGQVGTPERPLSDLGLRSYLAYWVSTIVRFFRRVLSVLSPEIVSVKTIANFPDMTSSSPGEVEVLPQRKKKKIKGFEAEVEGENTEATLGMMPLVVIPDKIFTSQRVFETTQREDGGAETHVKVECMLADIARATNLRVDDAAFALSECGFLMRRITGISENEVIVITRSLVEEVAKERNVKIMYMDLSCVLV